MKDSTSLEFVVPNGLDELEHELPGLITLIASTARWVHPQTFHALPVWYPETARGQPIYDAKWSRIYNNTTRTSGRTSEKSEPNIRAGSAFVAALGARKTENWTVCHIWGVDDPTFQRPNTVVRDPRFYSCVGNMIWLPTPLKGFTDCVPSIRMMLRTCAFYLYGWCCEHPDVANHAEIVRSGTIPLGYPDVWPAPGRDLLPPGTAPFGRRIAEAIDKRKAQLRTMLADESLIYFPREQVRNVLNFWKVVL
jgi:hypothetical protein